MHTEQSIVVDAKSPGGINSPHGLILFDGVCVLCSGGCRFVSKRDRRGYFRLVPIQLAEGRPLAGQLGIDPDRPDSFAFVANGQAYVKSEAALRLARASALAVDMGLPLHPTSGPHGDAVLHRLLHLVEGAHLDLAHALARDAKLGGEVLERDRVIDQPPRLEDAPLALVEHVERIGQRLAAVILQLPPEKRGTASRSDSVCACCHCWGNFIRRDPG